MRMRQSLISTLRETPRDAEIVSHQLMIRAGLISKVASGIYTLLPLGYKVIQKFESIVREELNTIGGQEVLMPMVCPSSLWEQSGRWHKYGKELLRLNDRHGNEFCLGPTHEEVITDLVKQTVSSYKKLPLLLYQIQTKFRDEIRPRFGLMRGREFIMKDAYSFHHSFDSLDEMYSSVSNAYARIFQRCGLGFREVEADNGSIGGSASAEFMVTSDTGEDVIIECNECSYAANIETADVVAPHSDKVQTQKELPLELVSTPGLTTIQDQVEHMGIETEACLKSLLVDVDEETILVLLRGDHQLNELKLKKVLGASSVQLSSEESVKMITGANTGFAGPIGLKKPVRIIADHGIKLMVSIYSGANQTDYHYKNVVLNRDFSVDAFYDLRFVEKGDTCPRCTAGVLSYTRGIEVGHIFKLGTTYSESLEAFFLNKEGKREPFIMGCYGIGIGRTVAAAIEQHHDDQGIVWPLSLAPFQVSIIVTSMKDEDLVNEANSLYESLKKLSVDVIIDDREESPGVKFKDSALIGFPFTVVVGKQFKNEGKFEVQERSTGEKTMLTLSETMDYLKKVLNGA